MYIVKKIENVPFPFATNPPTTSWVLVHLGTSPYIMYPST